MIKRQLQRINNVKIDDLEDFIILNPYKERGEYLKVQLHTHSTVSDGKLSPEDLIKSYAGKDYDYLAITDHDRMSVYLDEKEQGISLISGEEMTYPIPYFPFGRHILRLFVMDKVRGNLQEKIDFTNSSGGMVVVCHPSSRGGLGTQSWLPERLIKYNNFSLLEIINHHADTNENLRYWHGLLKFRGADRPVWGLAVDDTHYPENINKAWLMIKLEKNTEKNLKESLNSGAFYFTEGPDMTFAVKKGSISIKTDNNSTIAFIDADFKVLKEIEGNEAAYEANGSEGFVRVEVEDKVSKKMAYSQPFWLKSV